MAGDSLGLRSIWQTVSKSAPRVTVPYDLLKQAIAELADDVHVEQQGREASPERIDAQMQ